VEALGRLYRALNSEVCCPVLASYVRDSHPRRILSGCARRSTRRAASLAAQGRCTPASLKPICDRAHVGNIVTVDHPARRPRRPNGKARETRLRPGVLASCWGGHHVRRHHLDLDVRQGGMRLSRIAAETSAPSNDDNPFFLLYRAVRDMPSARVSASQPTHNNNAAIHHMTLALIVVALWPPIYGGELYRHRAGRCRMATRRSPVTYFARSALGLHADRDIADAADDDVFLATSRSRGWPVVLFHDFFCVQRFRTAPRSRRAVAEAGRGIAELPHSGDDGRGRGASRPVRRPGASETTGSASCCLVCCCWRRRRP